MRYVKIENQQSAKSSAKNLADDSFSKMIFVDDLLSLDVWFVRNMNNKYK